MAVDADNRLKGSTFMVGKAAFRCVDFMGLSTAVFECNGCSALVTNPERHLKRGGCSGHR